MRLGVVLGGGTESMLEKRLAAVTAARTSRLKHNL